MSSSVFTFRLSDEQIQIVRKRAGGMSVGKYAARLVLEDDAASRIRERKAMARVVRAIHYALASGVAEPDREHVDRLLSEALCLLVDSAEPKTTDREDTL